jgi:hypothetical protein
MKRVYNATNLPEAALLADLLRSAGIDVHIFNQNAVGALGDVPFLDALPQIWVANAGHAALALEIIQEFRRNSALDAHPTWVCSQCGETNPGTFDVCWSCGNGVS